MDFIVLSLGSNVGGRADNLERARDELESAGIKVTRSSDIYETEPFGMSDQNDFLNQVLIIETGRGPEELLSTCLDIEKQMGRKRTVKNGPRVIDIDLLFYKDELIYSDKLVLPHPEIQERKFVLKPLSEIMADQKHPIFGSTIAELLDECEDELIVDSY